MVELRKRSKDPFMSLHQSKTLVIIVILVAASLGIVTYIGILSAPNFDAQVKNS
ncbi:MAG: hypothetical protein NTY03_00600 [Candidatus Bathyarchaeota archaeon]|nr:hypothetical protein [Candidatus Bathyarchaeota archaeon]